MDSGLAPLVVCPLFFISDLTRSTLNLSLVTVGVLSWRCENSQTPPRRCAPRACLLWGIVFVAGTPYIRRATGSSDKTGERLRAKACSRTTQTMSSLTTTTSPARADTVEGKGTSVTLAAGELLYPQGFTFFENRIGHFPGQPEPIKKIRYPKYVSWRASPPRLGFKFLLI